jgi:hypothetical protein
MTRYVAFLIDCALALAFLYPFALLLADSWTLASFGAIASGRTWAGVQPYLALVCGLVGGFFGVSAMVRLERWKAERGLRRPGAQ